MSEVPGRILVGRAAERATVDTGVFNRAGAAALLAAGIIFFAGSVADYVILWLVNRQGGPQWEFAAVTTTVEGMSRVVLGIALMYGGLHVRGAAARWPYRAFGIVLIFMAIGSIALAALMAMDFLALRSSVRPEAVATFHTTTAKTLFLCAVYFAVTLPAGIASLLLRRRVKA